MDDPQQIAIAHILAVLEHAISLPGPDHARLIAIRDFISSGADVYEWRKAKVDGLRVREKPVDGRIVSWLYRRGPAVKILETVGDWGRCERGWIYLPYTELISKI